MPRYYPGDHDHTVVPPLPYGAGRDNADNEPKTVQLVAMHPVELADRTGPDGRPANAVPGDIITVGPRRATWLIATGKATRPEDYKVLHPEFEIPA